MAATNRFNPLGPVVAVVVGIAGVVGGTWVLGRLMARMLEELAAAMGAATADVARATGDAIGGGVARTTWEAPDAEGEALPRPATGEWPFIEPDDPTPPPAVDPTYRLLPDPPSPRSTVAVLGPGESLIPGDV